MYAAIIVLAIIAGTAKAVMDTLQFHYDDSLLFNRRWNKLFWDPYYSWRNKYKKGRPENGPRFLFSTTLFVFVTDGWHLMQFIMWNSIFSIIIILLGIEGALISLAVIVGFKLSFYVFYNFILKKN